MRTAIIASGLVMAFLVALSCLGFYLAVATHSRPVLPATTPGVPTVVPTTQTRVLYRIQRYRVA
ncbi:MAG: hypothetical protein M3281_02080 [Chloroflexota bacterium]|nr:hypothetical protein [Chloroflexota bacterium]